MYSLVEAIKKELNRNARIKVISFDVFDTILFRMVRKPVDVFEYVGKKAQEQNVLPAHVSPVIYKNIRIEAEKQARRKSIKYNKHNEVTLDEIIENLPAYCGENKDALLQLELEAEKELCYLNPDIYAVMDFLKDSDCRILLTSDMYLSGNRILNLLECNGFPIEIIDAVYVSCEYKQNKSGGELYQQVLNDMGVTADEMLHIGDNYMSDVVVAKHLGINTIYYDVINSDKYIPLQIEQMKYGNLLPQLYALRRYAADQGEVYGGEKQFWFQLGAMYLGPLMTGFAEYILDTADKEQIRNIYPLMREGMIISKLLKQAAKCRDKEYRIEPMYISRKAVYLASLREFGEEEYEKISIIFQKNGLVKDFLNLLELEESIENIPMQLSIAELRKDKKKEDEFKQYLFSKSVQQKISENIEKRFRNLIAYLQQLGIEEDFITADIGYQGTIQQCLENVLNKRNNKLYNIHLIAVGALNCVNKILDGIDIRGWTGSCGENEKNIVEIMEKQCLLEQFLMYNCGTTVGYRKSEQGYVPQMLEKMDIPMKQWEDIESVQQGILAFQREYLELKNKKSKSVAGYSSKEALQIVLRLFQVPIKIEAEKLGNMVWDDSFTQFTVKSFCDERYRKQIVELGVDAFINTIKLGANVWVEGLVTQVEPMYYLDKVLDENANSYEKAILAIVRNVVIHNPDWVVVVGAGEAGRALQKYLDLYGVKIEAFTDNNVKLQGSMVNGIPVKTLRDVFKTSHYVIASFAYADEIYEQIREIKGTGVKVYRN